MRILLAQNSLYYPAHGGGDKSNRLLMEALAARGHACRAVARISAFGDREAGLYAAELAARGTRFVYGADGVVRFERGGVDVHVATRANLRACFVAQIEEFGPDVILCSTDDPAQLLLEPALRSGRRVVYLARAPLALPFGPECAFPSETKTARIRAADLAVGVSQYVADYIREHAGIPAVHVPISLMEPEQWPVLGEFGNEFVTLVNPCAVKGIDIFLSLAEAFPDTAFAAVPTWGTNERDRAALAARSNVRLLHPVDDINKLLRRTRVLLVPSLWAEARSRIVLEAMLRGVPVMASRVGGVPEAKMGVPYLLPVNPITKYQARVDEQMVPVAEVPPQNIGPWRDALARLLGDRAHYEEIARQSRMAAMDYAAKLTAEPFEKLLSGLRPRSSPGPADPKTHTSMNACPTFGPADDRLLSSAFRQATQDDGLPHVSARGVGTSRLAAEPRSAARLDALSPEKRRLLALRLRRNATPESWFPGIAAVAGARLFCFPHAGGGAATFAGWPSCCPVRLPGREARIAEAPFERMGPLVEALAAAIEPYLDRKFAFFGHSMGAVVAYELARALRRHGLPAPAALLVSAARAPQYRRNHVSPPDPTDEQLLAELRRLEGTPPELLDDPVALRALLPALRADAALYRHYVYEEDAPLGCPIRAYGGAEDPNVSREQLETWAECTVAPFRARVFPGGHFFLHAWTAEILCDLETLW